MKLDWASRQINLSTVLRKTLNSHFSFKLNSVPFDEYKNQYLKWVKQDVNLVFRNKDTNEMVSYVASKRGNTPYKKRVLRRYLRVKDALFKKWSQNDDGNIWYFTATLDDDDIYQSWKKIGTYWNLFITKLRRWFEKVYCIRTFESQERGIPHIHAILYIPDMKFNYYLHRSRKDGKLSYRLQDHDLVNNIKSKWSYKKKSLGFSDLKVMKNIKKAYWYLFKYITKDLDVNNCDKIQTLVYGWLFSKRMFSFSRSFIDLIQTSHISNYSLYGIQFDEFVFKEYYKETTYDDKLHCFVISKGFR